MLIIHNRRGGILALLGVAAGIVPIILFQQIWMGFALAGLIWLWLGWPGKDKQTGKREFYPHVYFIPIPVFGLVATLLAVPLYFVKPPPGPGQGDPRQIRLDRDVKTLEKKSIGGDSILSTHILDALSEMSMSGVSTGNASVFTRTNDTKTLVLVSLPNLKQADDNARMTLLATIDAAAAKGWHVNADQIYIGIRGKYLYGAIQYPTGVRKVGTTVDEQLLLPFYEKPAAPAFPSTTQSSDQ